MVLKNLGEQWTLEKFEKRLDLCENNGVFTELP